MNVIGDIIERVLVESDKQPLSKARLTKLVYLVDWISAVLYGKQQTEIEWFYNYYGPYVPDVIQVASEDARFSVDPAQRFNGDHVEMVSLKMEGTPALSVEVLAIVHSVVSKTKHLTYTQFKDLVYRTFPIVATPQFNPLDLIGLARDYRAAKASRS